MPLSFNTILKINEATVTNAPGLNKPENQNKKLLSPQNLWKHATVQEEKINLEVV